VFQKATKKQCRARVALDGPSGSGKTYTGLIISTTLANGGKVAVIDSERGSASKYADEFEFDVCQLIHFSPHEYIKAIHAAEQAGYAAILIDSLSHAWSGIGGALEMVDNATARSRSGNSYAAWREVTPVHNALVDAMLQSTCHVVATMRAKTEYVLEDDGKGKKTPRKIGLAPVQRDGMEYEFDIVGDMDFENRLIVSKTRCKALRGQVVSLPGPDFAKIILDWVSDGAPQEESPTKSFVEAVSSAPTTADIPIPPKKPTAKEELPSVHPLAALPTPTRMVAGLKKALVDNPVGENIDKWKLIYSQCLLKSSERMASGEWKEGTADEVIDQLGAIKDLIDSASQMKEALSV
jgi:hypothetical protein